MNDITLQNEIIMTLKMFYLLLLYGFDVKVKNISIKYRRHTYTPVKPPRGSYGVYVGITGCTWLLGGGGVCTTYAPTTTT